MPTITTQDHLARALAYGGFFTTIFVAAWWTVEPVNAPKMVALAMTAGACLGILIAGRFELFKMDKLLITSLVAFVLISMVTLLSSADPVEINLFGVGGRNSVDGKPGRNSQSPGDVFFGKGRSVIRITPVA